MCVCGAGGGGNPKATKKKFRRGWNQMLLLQIERTKATITTEIQKAVVVVVERGNNIKTTSVHRRCN